MKCPKVPQSASARWSAQRKTNCGNDIAEIEGMWQLICGNGIAEIEEEKNFVAIVATKLPKLQGVRREKIIIVATKLLKTWEEI